MRLVHILSVCLLYAATCSVATIARVHYSDVLKVKCDTLPYRSYYTEETCYFMVDTPMGRSEAAASCSRILNGAKLVGDAPSLVWSSLFVEKWKFHQDGGAAGAKLTMCAYVSEYSCPTGSRTLISGRCIVPIGKKTHREAADYCTSLGGSLPSPANDLEDREISVISEGEPTWLLPSYSPPAWTGKTSFSRFGICDVLKSTPAYFLARDPSWCEKEEAIAMNPNDESRGYWALTDQSNLLNSFCIVDGKSDFWTAPVIPTQAPSTKPPRTRAPRTTVAPTEAPSNCIANHQWNEKLGYCEWTGPQAGCMQLFTLKNVSTYITIPNYPTEVFAEYDFTAAAFIRSNGVFNELASRVVVRRGCMVTVWTHPFSTHWQNEIRILNNAEYGDWEIQTPEKGTAQYGNAANGASAVSCFCDPTVTERLQPPRKECAPYHEWDEKKQHCVWTLDKKYCGELRTSDGKKLLMEMLNYPMKNLFDVNLNDVKRLNDFKWKVTEVVVRQGCIAQIYSGGAMRTWAPLKTSGYGVHQVASFYNGLLKSNDVSSGALRVLCACSTGESPLEKVPPVPTPAAPECIEGHRFDKETGRCEWTGAAEGCVIATNTRNETMTFTIPKWPIAVWGELDIWQNQAYPTWNEEIWKATVRRGCMANLYYDPHYNKYCTEDPMLANVEYGTYLIDQREYGGLRASYYYYGLSRVDCYCDNLQIAAPPQSPSVLCLPGHAYSEKTRQCEWTGENNVCGELTNSAGKSRQMKIPNWPKNKRFDVNFLQAVDWHADFYKNVATASVRQHCFVTLLDNIAMWNPRTLETKGYGKYSVKAGTIRAVCECFY